MTRTLAEGYDVFGPAAHPASRHGYAVRVDGRLPAVRAGAGPGHLIARLSAALGGPVRARVVVLLALVLALTSADSGTIGAVGAPLEADLGISHAQLGLFA